MIKTIYFIILIIFVLNGCSRDLQIEVDASMLPLEIELGVPFSIEDYINVLVNGEGFEIDVNNFDSRVNYNRVGDYEISLLIPNNRGEFVEYNRSFKVSVVDTVGPNIYRNEGRVYQLNRTSNINGDFYCEDISGCEITEIIYGELQLGANNVVVIAKDNFGNQSRKEFEIVVYDEVLPIVRLDNSFVEINGSKFVSLGYFGDKLEPVADFFVTDNYEITYLSRVDTQTPGSYTLSFYGTDEFGYKTPVYSEQYIVSESIQFEFTEGIDVLYDTHSYKIFGRFNSNNTLGKAIGIQGTNSLSSIVSLNNDFSLEWFYVYESPEVQINDVHIMKNGNTVIVGRDSRLIYNKNICSSLGSINGVGFIQIFNRFGEQVAKFIDDSAACDSNYLSLVSNGNLLLVHSRMTFDSIEDNEFNDSFTMLNPENENAIQVFSHNLDKLESHSFRNVLGSVPLRSDMWGSSKMIPSFSAIENLYYTKIILDMTQGVFILSPNGILETILLFSSGPDLGWFNHQDIRAKYVGDINWCSKGLRFTVGGPDSFLTVDNSVYWRTPGSSECNKHGSFLTISDYQGNVLFHKFVEDVTFLEAKSNGFPFDTYNLFTYDSVYLLDVSNNSFFEISNYKEFGEEIYLSSRRGEYNMYSLIFPNGYGWQGSVDTFSGYISRQDGVFLKPILWLNN